MDVSHKHQRNRTGKEESPVSHSNVEDGITGIGLVRTAESSVVELSEKEETYRQSLNQRIGCQLERESLCEILTDEGNIPMARDIE